MEVVYYADKDLGYCPVKKYLSKLTETKVFADIDSKIQHVKQNDGRPTPPISKSLHTYSFFEIRTRKNKDVLIRICYCRHKNKIVLLHSFEKSDHEGGKKEKKYLEKEFTQANIFIRNF